MFKLYCVVFNMISGKHYVEPYQFVAVPHFPLVKFSSDDPKEAYAVRDLLNIGSTHEQTADS